MRKLSQRVVEALERGENTVLVTVIESHGSAPRGIGACMLVYEDGTTVGTTTDAATGGVDGVEDPDGAPLVLLVRRSDDGSWTPVTGIIDPCELPSEAAVRLGPADALLVFPGEAHKVRCVWEAPCEVRKLVVKIPVETAPPA